ncbi:ATP-binding protein [Pseudonocardia sp. Ae505_Ps2]|uniref:ATP-binding protein n=1 Tax=Pseudonocardia sp. Ae505_Ps2 TaxID=1885034 RepID=UPI000960A421|nr:ATP-binding protein [Pseudonocardia sp. Ae505_Ps2]OLM08441.1 putative ATP-binding protein [Pseudonocardia sp. Ae505_Ps2]
MSISPRRRRRRRPQPRSTGELLAQFTDLDGIPLTPPGAEPDQPIEQGGRRSGGRRGGRLRVNQATAPGQGPREPGRGWAAVDASRRAPVYRATAAEVGGLFPLLAANGVPAIGARLGYDTQSGGAFYVHPTEWVLRGMVTNPNLVVFGEPGRGKSSTVVALMLRMMLFGVRSLISGDVKGEYTPLLRALGITPIALGRGSPHRLNALDLGPIRTHWTRWNVERQREELTGITARWTRLLTALAEAQGYPPTVTDELVLATVLRRLVGATNGNTELRPITIPQVVAHLAEPADDLWRELRFADRRQFLDHTRPITDALSNLVVGPLSGLFDEPTNFDLDWDAPVQSMDLSLLRSRGDQAIAVALTCLGSWSSMITDLHDDGGADSGVRIVVRDEVWRQMRLGLRAVQAVDSDLRLSRAERKIQLLVMHKPSDLLSVGAAGSQEVSIAQDLLALCSTRILLGQSTRVGDELADDLGLSEREQAVLTGWAMEGPGRALWKLENRPGMKIQTVLSATERATFDTNAGLRGDRRKPPHTHTAVEALTSHNTTSNPEVDSEHAHNAGHPTGSAGVNGTLTNDALTEER